ncbi:MAG TPA: (d)CMP kinase [Acidimicrobiales bacterium]|nr:(d)CMP kinase [Acidimicrobiales bacterium]
MRVIAIDGPSGAGKTTVARAVAARLDTGHLDTGAMYRSVALSVLRKGVDPEDRDSVAGVARDVRIDVGDEKVVVDGEDVTTEIRGEEVTRVVSAVASNPGVREEMVRRQREWAEAQDVGVVEGRDIGTVVFPDAELKVYLMAGDAVRARRRSGETGGAEETVAADMARRDEHDSTRASSPLKAADDAVVLDTSDLTVDQVVEEVLRNLNQ